MKNQQEITSIVVLAYNGLKEVTRPCIESILKNTPKGSYELVLVDNASSDGTAAYFEALHSQYDHITLCLNQQNKGYAGGNNDGMRLAKGAYIVLLNNDTLVPQGWLNRLLGLLKANGNVGLVGPVTNSAGNEQRIEISGLNESNFEQHIAPYLERQRGRWFTTERLGFYCVAMKRVVMERVGLLDERFGLGMFEDDDYCIRVRNAGYALAVTEDCFVYHKGSVSFGKLSVDSYRELFMKNRALFTRLHGTQWSFADIALRYWEKFNADLSSYRHNIDEANINPAIERVLVRWENFHHLLVQVHRAELAGLSEAGAKDSPIIKRAKWKIRWHHFRRNVMRGTWSERRKYVAHIALRLKHRLLSGSAPGGLYPEVQALVSAVSAPATGTNVVIFPATVDYSYMTQRPQQLANAFADAGYFVIYGTLNNISDKVDVAQQIRTNLWLVNERCFPHLVHVVQPDKAIYYCMWPNNAKHLDYLPYSPLLYDYMDELSLLDLPSDELERDHQYMLEKADLITVSADRLMEKLPQHVLPKALLINNAVSSEFIKAVEDYNGVADELAPFDGRPVLGYYGAIAEWLDFDLVERLATDLPEAVVVLVGPVSEGVTKRISMMTKTHPNILLLPPRKQLELVPLLKRFDVCLIPFVKNPVTDAVSPVKLFEYFTTGKSVVTTDLAECAKYSTIHIGKTHESFVRSVKSILAEPGRMHDEQNKLIALDNTWNLRVAQILAAIAIKDIAA
ncbi:MAG: glycosyltransferase [Betaproteobacteria bacterium]|nr:glycosyltransferase [Betaproteobacteria bacterium]